MRRTYRVPYRGTPGCDSATTCRIHERLAALAPFARVSFERQLSLEELLPLMEGLAHWPYVVRAYNLAKRRLSCVRNPEWKALYFFSPSLTLTLTQTLTLILTPTLTLTLTLTLPYRCCGG